MPPSAERTSTMPTPGLGRRLLRVATWTGMPIVVGVAAFGWLTWQVKDLSEKAQRERLELASARVEASALRTERERLALEVNTIKREREGLAEKTEALRNELEGERSKLAETKRVADLVQEMALGARTPEQRARALYAAARNAMEQKDDSRALTLLTAAVGEDPGNSEAFNALGLVTARLNRDWHVAEKNYLRAVELNPRNVFALHNLADLYRWHREYSKAREFAARALSVKPDYAPAKLLLQEIDQLEHKTNPVSPHPDNNE